jgi:hypothetical protein
VNVCRSGEGLRVKYPATRFATTTALATTTTEAFPRVNATKGLRGNGANIGARANVPATACVR